MPEFHIPNILSFFKDCTKIMLTETVTAETIFLNGSVTLLPFFSRHGTVYSLRFCDILILHCILEKRPNDKK